MTAHAVADIVKERATKVGGSNKERSHPKIFWERCYNNCSKFQEHTEGKQKNIWIDSE